MDKWENLIEEFPPDPDVRWYNKMHQTATVTLKEDLADFEIRRYLRTLFRKPISLIATIQNRRNEISWSKAITDMFKLIGDIVETHGDGEWMEEYYEDLSNLCMLNYDPKTQANAYRCLTNIVKRSEYGAVKHKQIIDRFEMSLNPSGTCKAPLAILVGAICEYCPALVKEYTLKVFRIYLRMMDSNRNSDTITNAILKGLNGVFKNLDLPTAELMMFYTKMSSSSFIKSHKHEEAILTLLENHAGLFREKVAEDLQLREYLWSILKKATGLRGGTVAAALLSVYGALCDVLETRQLKTTIKADVVPKVKGYRLVKYTALRILTYVQTNKQISFEVDSNVDMQKLEFELRSENVSYDCVDAIKWCIGSGLPNSNRLLQTAVLYYTNLPTSKRKDIVVDGVLNADSDLRQEITQTLNQLLNLTSHILSYQTPSRYTKECCSVVADCCLRLLRDCCATAALLEVVAELMRHCEEELPLEIYEYINTDRCCDEAMLCASCVSLIQAPDGRVNPNDMLIALEVMFSRNDVEPKMLIKCLQKLESYIDMNTENSDRKHLSKVINLVEKLRLRRDLVGKDARVLQRDVEMFLGKHSVYPTHDMNNNALDTVQMTKLKTHKLIILDIPNTTEGATVYKLTLERILQQALIDEHPETLQSILTIICVNLSRQKEMCLQTALCRVLHALCRVHSRGLGVDTHALLAAAHLCATPHCANLLATYISKEKSPGVRRMLSDALESLLLEDPSSDNTVSLVNTVAKQAFELMESDDSTKRRAGLDITQSLIVALKDSHSCIEKLLPKILILISKTAELDSKTTFEIASKLFIEHIYIFEEDVLNNIIKELIEILFIYFTTLESDLELTIYKNTVKMCAVLIKNIFDTKTDGKIFDYLKNMSLNKDGRTFTVFEVARSDEKIFQKLIYVVAILKTEFVNDDLESDVNNSEILNQFLDLKFDSFENNFDFESTLYFVMEYNSILLDNKYQEIHKCIASIIKKLNPSNIIYLHKLLPNALLAFKTNDWPKILTDSYQNWFDSLPIEGITENLNNMAVDNENVPILKSIRIMSEIFKIKMTAIGDWPLIIYNGSQDEQVHVSELSNLTDALTAVRMTATDVKRLMTDGASDDVREFFKTFMEVFFEILVSKPFLLIDQDLKDYCSLIKDVVKWCIKKKMGEKFGADVLELINEVWPIYETKTDFHQIRELLHDLLSFPMKLSSDSRPIKWATRVLWSNATGPVEKSLLVGILPGGPDFRTSYRLYVSKLPVRLSEMCPPFDSMFRALLDALAANGDLTILDIVLSLAKDKIRCFCRCSTPALCEKFFSKIIKDLLDLSKRRQMAPTNTDAYHHYVMTGVKEFTVLQVAFEMIPSISLESPSSVLYEEIVNDESWYIVRSVCKLCVTLRGKVTCPNEASEEIVEACRLFQCAAFNCLSSALCCRRPAPHFYNLLFDANVWSSVVDKNAQYTLPLKSSWNPKTRRHAVPIAVSDPNSSVASTLTLTRTVRTRLFVDILSEDPLHYDMFRNEDEENETATEELQLTDNELNNHEVGATLTCLLSHVSSLDSKTWLQTLVEAFDGDLDVNTKWILAQAVCNAKDELKRHASVLRPALLTLVKDTAFVDNDIKVLNGLHVEILDTISFWGDIDMSDETTNINAVIKYLIQTCLGNIAKEHVYKYLLDTMTNILNVYKSCIHLKWSFFEPYFNDQEYCKQVIQILLKITKNDIHVQGLAQNLLEKFDSRYTAHFSNMAELFGLAMKSFDDNEIREGILKSYWKILETHRRSETHIKLLYYAQLNCNEICDARNFRLLPTLVSQLTTHKPKCLKVISSYISNVASTDEDAEDLFASLDICQMISDEDTVVEAIGVVKNGFHLMGKTLKTRCVMLIAGYCQHSLVKVRKAALQVVIEVFKDLFKQESDNQPKRPKQDGSKLLKSIETSDAYSKSVLRAVATGCIDSDVEIANMIKAGIAACLCTIDMGVRFAEAFLVIILSLSVQTENTHRDLSVCMSAFLDVLFYDLRNQASFKSIKLREEPLFTMESSGGPSKLLTMSSTYQGTMRSKRSLSKNAKKDNVTDAKQTGINVQVTIASILDTILNFSKVNPETSQALTIEMMRILIEMKDRGFNLTTWMSKMLKFALSHEACIITPLIIEGARLLADDIAKEDGIENIISDLKKSTLYTEGEDLSKALYEDVILRRRGNEQFEIGSALLKTDFSMDEEKQFSLEDLVATFGKLANWDQLTIQEKECVKSSDLPLIWTDISTFRRQLKNYEGPDSWFGKMCIAYCGESKQDTIRLLSVVDRWPRRLFVTSAITETINWEQKILDDNCLKYPCVIRDADCLAEWAARLMIRSAHVMSTRSSDERAKMLSRSDELKWCVSANERGLSALVLQCVNRNKEGLYEDEILPWLEQKVVALRNIGLEQNDFEKLRKALEIADEYSPIFLEKTSPDIIMSMYKLILQLNCDLDSLTSDKLDDVLKHIDKQTEKKTSLTEKNRQILTSVYFQAMIYYTDLSNEEKSTNERISEMSDILHRVISHNLKDSKTFLALILNKFNNFKDLDEETSRKLMNELQKVMPSLDQLFVDILVEEKGLISADVSKEFHEEQKSMEIYKKYFQLVNDAEHCLWMYCEDLMECVKAGDQQKWATVFANLKQKIFENPFKGTDYQILMKHKRELYQIEDYAKTDPTGKNKVFNGIKSALGNKKEKKTIRLSQLCKRLVDDKSIAGDASVARLLGLLPGITAVKFDEQVTVFTDSKRRPCMFRAILSNGESRKYLHKCGEPVRVDSAALSVQRACNSLWRVDRHVYNVTPLSEDCGLIEYLEDHERVRSLISGVCELKIDFKRTSDTELILTPIRELVRLHDRNCSKIPSYALRSAIEKNSANTEDFIAKKKNFLSTLATMTVLNWVLGVGDRHLENIMYSKADGGLVCIDWAYMFKYGAGYEPAPARLTRNLLAVCDVTVLESRIQHLMRTLRSAFTILMPYINVAFQSMGKDFSDKKKYVEGTMRGTLLSYEVAKEIIQNSKEINYKDKYIELYDNIFPPTSENGVYSVEEQVTAFLKHCTDRRILGVTRKGWEPWI
ncbi:hypothetical protein K1T71_014672 [Dendrolimus kikuchii]|uniref:Uncharacterized protein n=1 Tax=Dendrolimus kikuchii TaxID=765133 RepID=A0ACC1CET0_9NEOP|nr:hypothetical protein K1T71_014672 [Dendrolimus kikuchii]